MNNGTSPDVCVLVGHSTTDPGAVANGVKEYEWNVPLVEAVAARLRERGLVVTKVARPPGKGGYSKLPGLVNATRAGCALEFHLNSGPPTATGSEVLYWKGSARGESLARAVQGALTATLGLRDRGVKALEATDRGGYLLQHTTMPTIIVESFFLSNSADLKTGEERREALATAIADAVRAWRS